MTLPSTLQDIRLKVRRIVRAPSVQQMTDAEIDAAINTFYLYDMPEHLRLEELRSTYSFTTVPNQDVYAFPVDTYMTLEGPLYIAGYESYFSQSRTEFFRQWPEVIFSQTIAAGNGTIGPYAATLTNVPLQFNNVLVSGVTTAGVSLTLNDNGAGALTGDGTGTINYITGAISVTFSGLIATTSDVIVQYYPYVASRPTAMLFYQNSMTLRPIPDQAYTVTVDAFIVPTQLISSGQSPQLKEWGQLLAYGASLKIFEDRSDFQKVSQFRPLMEEQLMLINRRTIKQMASMRAATIYTEQSQYYGGNFQRPF